MNESEKWAEAFRVAYEEQRVQDIRSGRDGQSGPNPAFGGGIGNLSGWVCFAGMVGAVLGGITGRGPVGAVIGALLFGGLVWLPGIFLKPSPGSSVSRRSVMLWTLSGAAAGVVFGVVFALGWDIVFLEDVLGNAVTNFGFLGALAMGGYRLRKRACN